MKKGLYILLIMLAMCRVAVRADIWKSHKSLNRSTSTGKSWNYTGTKLNGITHGGGLYESNSYQRTNHNEDNGMMSSRLDYNRTAGNSRDGLSGKTSSYNVSFNGEPVRKSNFHIVSSRVSAGRAGAHGGFFAGGASAEKTYRYGRRSTNYGAPVNSAVIVNVKHPAAKDANGNVVVDNERMNSASRDQFGNPKSPLAAPYGDLGALMTYDRNGGLGPAGRPVLDDTPLGDGLSVLLLMAAAMVVWKMRK